VRVRACVCVCVCVCTCACASASGESGFALDQVMDLLACLHMFPQSLERSEPLRDLGYVGGNDTVKTDPRSDTHTYL
jgi:hypothetical protein